MYSYIIDIDLSLVSDNDYKNITGENKSELIKKSKDNLEENKKDMLCSYDFL